MLSNGPDGQMVFNPSVLEVEVGDKVTFIPSDPTHDSISIFTPKDAKSWHGKRDQKISVTIEKEGVYIYKCAPHFYYGMIGVIHTKNPDNLDAAKQKSTAISKRFITNKSRLSNYLNSIKK